MIKNKILLGSLLLTGCFALSTAWLSRELKSAKEVISNLEGWQVEVVEATQLASGSKDLTTKTVKVQIQALGQSLISLRAALDKSNDAVDQLSRETHAAQQRAKREDQIMAPAIRKAESVINEMQIRSEAAAPLAHRDDAVRQAQDAAYEAGL